MTLWSDLAGVFPSLERLPEAARPHVVELIPSARGTEQSLCVVFDEGEALRMTAPEVPAFILSLTAHRYAVDLDSLGTGAERYYVDEIFDPEVALRGWICAGGVVAEEKTYRRAGPGRLLIDRRDANGAWLTRDEPECVGSDVDWSGEPHVLESARAALAAGEILGFLVLKKEGRSQSYLRIYGVVP